MTKPSFDHLFPFQIQSRTAINLVLLILSIGFALASVVLAAAYKQSISTASCTTPATPTTVVVHPSDAVPPAVVERLVSSERETAALTATNAQLTRRLQLANSSLSACRSSSTATGPLGPVSAQSN